MVDEKGRRRNTARSEEEIPATTLDSYFIKNNTNYR
jgi:hypothetical protein